MQIIAILIGLVLLAAIVFYVSRPIVQHRRGGTDATVMATLEAQRDGVYSQIRELDMDHATGKMNDEDYHQARTDLVAQAATLLKQIDGVFAAPTVPAAIATATLPASDDVEALIAARRKASAVNAASAGAAASAKPAAVKATPIQSGDADLEAAIAARRKKVAATPVADDVEARIAARRKSAAPTPVAAAMTCPTCGKPITPDDAFCSKCGTPLKAAAR